MVDKSSPTYSTPHKDRNNPQELKDHQIEMINQAIGTIGDYGEVRLIVERGRLRFLVTQKSFDLLKPPSRSIEFEFD